MEQTFDNFLSSLLEAYEKNPAQDVDALIEKKCKEWGVSEEQMAFLRETNSLIDDFADNAASLQNAKEEGKSRKSWMLDEIDHITEDRTEEEKAQIVSVISDASSDVIEETINTEETKD